MSTTDTGVASATSAEATTTALTPQQSAEANLRGQPALTPIIAGSVCGSVIVIAWSIGLVIWLRKRKRRRERILAGRLKSKDQPEDYIIPPDPAVLSGAYTPGPIVHTEQSRHTTSSTTAPDTSLQTEKA